MPNALITGITGQDGAYLSRLLVKAGYHVWGTARAGSSLASLEALGLAREVTVLEASFVDQGSLERAVEVAQPDEVYNLAAQSSVARSFEDPVGTGEVSGLGAVRLFEAVRKTCPRARVCQASSAEIFGAAKTVPQTEETPLAPRSPYGAAKAYAHAMARVAREGMGMHVCAAILYNHESPLRPEQFVTRKITLAAARIKVGRQQVLELGDLSVQRDWGFAGDTVRAMHAILQHDEPGDYIVATGPARALRDLVEAAFGCVGLRAEDHVRQDAALLRPSEVPLACGDASKAARVLGWRPRVSFEEMVAMMVEADLKRLHGEDDSICYHAADF